MLALRDAMPDGERAAASAAICDRANALLAARLIPGALVALYAAKGSEVDTKRLDELLRVRGMTIVYPRVIGDGQLLAFHAITLDDLVPARFGLREPRPEAAEVAVADIAAFVVPGLAFDRAGWRIGWGRGHYDATLAAASPSALRLGLAYECQLVDQVAREPHDVAVHAILTQLATYMVA